MKALLMFPDRDFQLRVPSPNGVGQWDAELALWRRPRSRTADAGPHDALPLHERMLVQDLEIDTLLRAMSRDDEFLWDVARQALLSGVANDAQTVRYRQEITKDCLENPSVTRSLYALATETLEKQRRHYFSVFSNHPGSILYRSIEALQTFIDMLKRLRGIADAPAGTFESRGLTTLFAMLRQELNDAYIVRLENHLTDLKFRHGLLVSAGLGNGNEGTDYVLRQPREDRRHWIDRFLGRDPDGYTFYIHERDESGARALSDLKDRGINLAANALAQSTDHILSFFDMLRTEVAFYVGCVNLHETLTALAAPVCFPRPEPLGARILHFGGLYDVCLALSMGRRVVGNALDANGDNLVIVTGANQGGKSTFLRSLGLAQLMMQCGTFVPADFFAAELATGLFTHFKREEDATMKHGKLDEELARLSEIVDRIRPNAAVFFNESFASTNELEGSEIARQVVGALLDRGIKVYFVTHLYGFAHGMFETRLRGAVFLCAERQPDGTRTFRMVAGEPSETSYGEDLYREIFAVEPPGLPRG